MIYGTIHDHNMSQVFLTRKYLAFSDESNLVEIIGGTLVKAGHVYFGVESMFQDILASGVEVWRPTSGRKGNEKLFVVREYVAEAIVLWLSAISGLTDNGSLITYADMGLREYLKKAFSEEVSGDESKQA